MKKLMIALILMSVALAAAAQDSTAVADRAKSPWFGEGAEQMALLLQWFVYALVVISAVSAVRMYLAHRKRKKDGEAGKNAPGGTRPETPPAGPGPVPGGMPQPRKAPVSYTFITIMVMLGILFLFSWLSTREQIAEQTYSQFMDKLNADRIKRVEFTERDIVYTDLGDVKYHTVMPPLDDEKLVPTLLEKKIEIVTKKPSRWIGLISYIPLLGLIIIFWLFFFRRMNGQNSLFAGFGKSRAKMHAGNKSLISFKDVAGVNEAKEELQEIVDFLKDPRKFQRLGGKIPRGVLLVGQPGTGKTLLAKAVSGEAGVPFFSISGSDFDEMFVGVGAARVRDLFDQAKKNAPCITFIDEIDAVGRHRGASLGTGSESQTLNQLLVEMDGFEPNLAVIIIAATNRPDILDPALLRPGRFDRQVTVDLPDIKGRVEILKVHSSKVPLADDVHLELIARGTPGFSGADLANIVNEAALNAARQNKNAIDMKDFEEAKDKLVLGKEKRSRVIPEEDKKLTAYHEIGHVLTNIFLDKTEPVHKVSIIPRGFTGGATHFLLTDRTGYSRGYFKQKMVELLGGRAAEEIVFNELTTGAGNDIEIATEIAKKMVCTWGMSDKIGPLSLGKERGHVFLGKELLSRDEHSEETAKLVDGEIRSLIQEAHATALDILSRHRALLDRLSLLLIEKETMGSEEIFDIILKEIGEDEIASVKAKYSKALDMRFEHSNQIDAENGKAETPALEQAEE